MNNCVQGNIKYSVNANAFFGGLYWMNDRERA